MHKAPLTVAGIVFGIVALVHLYRLFNHFPIMINGTDVPIAANVVGLVVAGGLSLWMFCAAYCCGPCRK